MNKIYRLVWNRETGTMVVASELAKSDSSGVVITRRQGRARVALLAMAVMMALPAGNVWAADYVCVDPATGQPMPSSSVPGTGSEVACGQGAVTAGKDSIAIGTGATTSAAAESAIAIGTGAKVTQKNSFAFGSRAEATGPNSLAVGNVAIASAQSAAAFGDGAQAKGAQSTAVGVATKAQSRGASAFGHASQATGDHDLAAGSSAIASGGASIAMGSGAQSTGAQAIAMGQNARASGRFDVAIGRNAMNGATVAGSSSNIGIGDGALRDAVNSDNNSAIGSSAGNKLTGQHNVMFGAYANSTTAVNDYEKWLIANHPGHSGTPAAPTGNGVTANNTVAVGGRALAYALNSVAVGNRAWAIGASSIALGMSSKALGRYSIAQGYATEAGGVSSIAIGAAQNASNKTQATKNYAIAIGSINTLAAGESSIAFGHQAQATHDKAIALGKQTEAQAIGAVAIGGWGNPAELLGNRATISKAPYSVVLGTAAQANEFSDSAVVIGNQAEARGASIKSTAKDSVAIGYRSLVTTASNIAIGSSAKADHKSQATAIGNNANAKGYQSIALGSNSFADSDAGSGLALGREAQVTTGNAVALGSLARADRVARADKAGTDAAATLANGKVYANAAASQAAKDAVSATVQRDENFIGSDGQPAPVALGAVSVGYDYVDASGKRRHATRQITHVAAGTADSDAVNVAQLKAVAEVAEKPLAFAGDTGANVTRKLGETVKVTGGRDDEADLSELNIGVVANGSDTLEIKLAKDLIGLSSAQFQDADGNITTVDGDGISIEPADPAKGVVSLTSAGLDNGGNRITNVAAGVDDNDAVNVAQFNAARTRFYSVNSTDTTAGNYNNDGATGKYALAAGVNALAEQHESVAVGKGARTTGTESGSVAIGADATANGALGVAIGAGATASGDSSGGPIGSPGGIAIGSAASAKNGGMAIGSGAYSGNGTALLPGLPTLLNNNVALGDSARVKDDTNFRVALGTMSIAGEADLTATPYTPMTGATIAGIAAPGVTLGEVSVGGDNRTFPGNILYRRITNVAAGAADTDAVNVSQLKALANAPLAFSGDTGTDVSRKLGETVNIVGGVGSESLLTDANIGVVGDGTDTLEIKLAKDLIGLESASFDDGSGNETEINGKGLTIANADPAKVVSLTSAGLNNGGNQITNVASGGTVDTNAANIGDVKAATAKATSKVDAGDNIKVTSTTNVDGSTTYTVATKKDVAFDTVTVGKKPSTGTNHQVVMDSNGLAVGNNTLTGDAVTVNGTPVTNINNAINMIATQAYRPLAFAGDTGTDVSRKLGETVNIVGGVGSESLLTDANIGVVGDGTDTLEIKLAKDLVGLESAHFDDGSGNETEINGKGLTIANADPAKVVSLTSAGLNNGGNQITNVAAGELSATSTDAVNGSQLFATNQNVAANTAAINTLNTTVVKPITFAGDTGTDVSRKLGETVNIVGGVGSESLLTDANIGVVGDGTDTLEIKLAKDLVGLESAHFDDGSGNETEINGKGLTIANADPAKVVSLTSAGLNNGGNKITNVAAGVDDNDAVNFSQLKAVQTLVNAGWTVADSAGNKANIGPSGVVTFSSADSNIKVAQTGADQAGKVEITLNRNLDLDSVTAGGNRLDAKGLTIAGGPTISATGIDMGGKKISNLAAGTEEGDAVNLGQLKNHVREETAKVKTHYYSVNDGGAKGGNYDNDGATANGAIAAGVDTKATAENAVAMGKGAAASHVGSVALGADAQTQAVDNTGTFMLNGGTAAGVNAVAVVSVGSKGNERRIVNVAAGRLSADSTDAVNGSQLFAVGTAVNNLGHATALALGGNTTYTPGAGLSVNLTVGGNTYTNVQDALNAVSGGGTGATKVVAGTNTQVTRNGDTYTVSVVDKPVVDGKATFNGGIEVAGGQSVNMGGNVVRNVAAGVADTDAVNVGQLNGAIAGANAYTDGRFNQLANDMWQIDRGYRGATASAMAMAGLPQAYLPGKSMFSAAVGGYRGEYGLAFGLSGITDNGKWVYKAQASGNTARDWGFSAGVGVQW